MRKALHSRRAATVVIPASPRATVRRVSWALALAFAGGAFSPGCSAPPVVVVLHDQDAVRGRAMWAELVVYPGGCRRAADFPPSDAAFRAVVPAAADFPPIGDLPKKTFGFAALLRNGDCQIVAAGCTEANLDRVGKINIFVVTPTENLPGCVGRCDAGSCKRDEKPDPEPGKGGAGGGTNGECLALSRELPLPVAASPSPTVTSPTVIATPTGFLIVYRERGGTGQRDLITAVNVGKDGQIVTATQVDVDTCEAGTRTDDVGLGAALGSSSGLAFGDRPVCTGAPDGQDFVTLVGMDAAGALSPLGETGSDSGHKANRKAVSSGGSVVALGGAGRFAVVYRENAEGDDTADPSLFARVLIVKPGVGYGSAATPLPMPTRTTYAVGGLLGKSDLRVLTGDGQRLRMDSFDVSVDVATNLASPRPFEDLGSAQRAAMAGSEGALVIGQQMDKTVTLTTLRANGREQVTPASTEAALSLAVAVTKTHAFVAQGRKGAVTLSGFAFSAPKTEIVPTKLTLPTLAKWPGERLGLAAGNDAVLLAWTGNPTGDSASVGGYALFQCREK